MDRPNPCVNCSSTETSIAYASDPWCCVNCQKQIARRVGLLDDDLHADEFEAACNRLAEQARKKKLGQGKRGMTVIDTREIGEEIKRGRNWREVYGTQALLREAEGRGNWRGKRVRFQTHPRDLSEVL